jgi:hypothetical protein
MIGDHRRISFWELMRDIFLTMIDLPSFKVSIDHNKLFDISWQLGVRHQVAAAA